MNPDGDTGADRPQRPKKGGHRSKRARTRKALTRTAVAGGAVACTGAALGLGAPIAEALSFMIPVSGSGTGNTIQVNILEGNVFDTQLGILGGNVSDNTTGGGIAEGNGNGVVGAASGNGNTTQIDILSYNIFNPQVSIFGGNMSTNTTVSNVSSGNGVGSTNETVPGGALGAMMFGAMSGNGNTTQLALGSGNIFNPQYTLFGANISDNTAEVNTASGNGGGSTQYLSAGYLGSMLLGGTSGNGNTTQVAAGTTNIINPQFSFGAGNSSTNTASTNSSTGNGNGSTTNTNTGGLFGNTTILGQTGNGNTSQTSTGSGTISNDQLNFGFGGLIPVTTPVNQQQTLGTNATGADDIVTSTETSNPVVNGNTDSSPTPATPPASPSFSPRNTTVVNRLQGTDPGTAVVPILGSGGSSGTPGQNVIAEKLKSLVNTLTGKPDAEGAG